MIKFWIKILDKNYNSDDILIDYPHVGVGMYLVLKNSKRLFEDAKTLYDNKKFHNSIPLFIISIEESLKSHELSIKLRKRKSISSDEWGQLQDHNHKLKFVPNFLLENLESMNEEKLAEIAKETQTEEYIPYISKIIQINKTEMNITSQLQFLKEKCLYQNWNKEFCEWDEFDYLTNEQQEDLAFFIMKRAEKHLHELYFGIEYAVNIIRRDGGTLTDLKYPKYNEFREIKDFDTKLDDYETLIGDFPKYQRGEKIMEALLSKKAFGVIDQVISNEIIKKCINLIQKKDLDNWYPHPIIKAIFIASSGIKKNSEDGNYYGMSGDEDQTYGGEPMMISTAIVSKKDDIIKIEKILINDIEYDINDKIIYQILETELVIERHSGKEIPLEKMHEAYSKIGMKVRKLKDSEIELALSGISTYIDKGNLKGVSDEMITKIKSATKENWEELDPNVRSIIGMAMPHLKPEKNTIIMTGYVDPMRKFKVRCLLHETLIMQNKFLRKS